MDRQCGLRFGGEHLADPGAASAAVAARQFGGTVPPVTIEQDDRLACPQAQYLGQVAACTLVQYHLAAGCKRLRGMDAGQAHTRYRPQPAAASRPRLSQIASVGSAWFMV